MSSISSERQVVEIANCYDVEKYSTASYKSHVPTILGDVEYNTFFTNYLLPNMPCVLKDISLSWKCNKDWVENDKINYNYFDSEFGELDVPVADCDKLQYNAHCKSDMKLREFIDYLKKPNKENLFYLKDWHLRQMRPNDNFYDVPHLFASDWLNEYALDHNEDDFMFVYIGPQGSWTPLHSDVYSSFSWSVNITGLKKWIFFPPGEEEKFRDVLGNLPLSFNAESFENVKYSVIYQKKGEAIFVPSGWHHEVYNVEDTISINHNWINGCNLHFVWKALEASMVLVEQEIDELKMTPEFYENCQVMLKSLYGMDYKIFFKLILYISKKRIEELEKGSNVYFNKYVFGKNHIKFDLKCILNILQPIVTKFSHYDKYLSTEIKNKIMEAHTTITKTINK